MCVTAAIFFVSCASQPDLRVVTIEVTADHDGRIQPAANDEFRLLKGNLIDLLGGNSKEPKDVSMLSYISATLIESSYKPEIRERIIKVYENHSIATVKTDSQGKAKFPAVLPGSYHVVGFTRLRGSRVMVWNYGIELKKEDRKAEHHVVLNPANAATIVSYSGRAEMERP